MLKRFLFSDGVIAAFQMLMCWNSACAKPFRERRPRSAMPITRVACGPVEIFAVSLVQVAYMLTTCPYFDNLKLDIYDEDGPQCQFIKSVMISTLVPLALNLLMKSQLRSDKGAKQLLPVTTLVTFRTLSVHQL